jgi:hypothetical protein
MDKSDQNNITSAADQNDDPFAGLVRSSNNAPSVKPSVSTSAANDKSDPFAGLVYTSANTTPTVKPEAAKPVTRWAANPTSPQRPATPQKPIETFSKEGLADVGKSALSQLALGAAADIPGLPGSLSALYGMGKKKLTDLGYHAGEAITYLPAGSAQKHALQVAAEEAKRSNSEKRGDTSSIFGVEFPTSQGMEKAIRSQAPGLGYTPQTRAGKLVGATTRALPMGILTGGESVLARLGMAGASGLLSETAGQATEGTKFEAPARIIGAFGGPGAFNLARGSIAAIGGATSPQAEKILLQAIARDISNGTARMTPEQIKAAVANGTSVGLWNMGGAETRKVISKLGLQTPKAQETLENLNARIMSQNASAGEAVSGHVSDTLNLTQGPFDLQQAIRLGDKAEIDRLYKTLETHPSASGVSSPVLDTLHKSDTIKNIGRQVRKISTDPDSRIIVPQGNAPGNIFYWDQIKRELDDGIRAAYKSGATSEAGRLQKLKNGIVNELDTQVPEYQLARGASYESFGAQNAVEAGYNSITGRLDNITAGKVKTEFGKYTPEQKELFAQGIGNNIKEVAEKSGPDAVVRMLTDPNKSGLIKNSIGEANYNSILGKSQSEAFMKNAKGYSASMREPSNTDQFLTSQLLYDVAPALASVTQGNLLPIAKVIGGFAVKGSLNFYKDATLKRQAAHVLGLLGTEDPAQLADLARRIQKLPKGQSFIMSVLSNAKNASARTMMGTPTSQDMTKPVQQSQEGTAESPPNAPQSSGLFGRLLGAESSTGQFKKNGETVISPKGAVGAAQVMPGTGPEAAALAGEEWSLDRLRNDEAYNKKLGAAYLNKLLQVFGGDERKATAAYNAGPSGVQRAMERVAARGGTWEDHLPPETQGYLAKIFRATGGRIGRASGGRIMNHRSEAENLIRLADKTKKALNNSTESLLAVPDEAVTKALSIANEAI